MESGEFLALHSFFAVSFLGAIGIIGVIGIFAKLLKFDQQKSKIVNGGGNFVHYAVAESAAYLAYVSIYDASKVQKEPIGTIYSTTSK